MNHRIQRGITAVEVVIGTSIAGIILVVASHTIAMFINASNVLVDKTHAVYLAEDGLELLRYIRDNNWTYIGNLAENTTLYLEPTSTGVSVTNTPEIIGDFTRSFAVQNVYRNSTTDDIVASTTGGSVADTDSRYVTVTVSWGSESVALTSMLANQNP